MARITLDQRAHHVTRQVEFRFKVSEPDIMIPPYTKISDPQDVFKIMGTFYADKVTEIVVVLILDAHNQIQCYDEVSAGSLSASLIHPREVFRSAVHHLASSIIVCHNHPSGNPEPSREDTEIALQLRDAGKLLGIPMHDFIIIHGKGGTSFAERGII